MYARDAVYSFIAAFMRDKVCRRNSTSLSIFDVVVLKLSVSFTILKFIGSGVCCIHSLKQKNIQDKSGM